MQVFCYNTILWFRSGPCLLHISSLWVPTELIYCSLVLHLLLQICFATCFDPNVLADLRKKDKKAVSIQITANADLSYR
jgi:hypothetical protein